MKLAAPADLQATPASASASVTWTAPRNGGNPITMYIVTPYAGHRRLKPTFTSATSAAIIGLRNGTSYRFTIAARNALGTGPTSRLTNVVRPSASLLPATLLYGLWCTPL